MNDLPITTTAELRAAIDRVSFEKSCLDMGWRWQIEAIDKGDRDPSPEALDMFLRNGVSGTCVDCPRRAADGGAVPELCLNFSRHDHQIAWPYARGWRIRCSFQRPERDTGEVGTGFGRWWLIERGTTQSALWKTMFAAAKMIVEHELLEAFKVDGRRPFDPHRTVQDLVFGAEER